MTEQHVSECHTSNTLKRSSISSHKMATGKTFSHWDFSAFI